MPITANQRIEALDVVRGFALLGIFLMNIEYFNRTISSLDAGMPRGLTGIDWLASWFIAYFVQGKFWTIFSLLFGMGFAVMLTRAARGRARLQDRLLAARAGPGRLRCGALRPSLGRRHPLQLCGRRVDADGRALREDQAASSSASPLRSAWRSFPAWGMSARSLSALRPAGLLAIYLRSGKRVNILGHGIPLFSFLLLVIGSLLVIAAAVFWLLPDGPVEPRLPLSVFGPLLLIAGWLSWKYYEPAEKRSVRLAVSVYLFLGIVDHRGRTHSAFRTRSRRRRGRGRAAGERERAVSMRPPLRDATDKPVEEKPTARNRPGKSAPPSARLRGRSGSPKRKRKTRRSYASSPAAAIGRRSS